jgi:hypothetical protein
MRTLALRAAERASYRDCGVSLNLVLNMATARICFSKTEIHGLGFPSTTPPSRSSSASARCDQVWATARRHTNGASTGLKCSGSTLPTIAKNAVRASLLKDGGGLSRAGRPSTRGAASSAADRLGMFCALPSRFLPKVYHNFSPYRKILLRSNEKVGHRPSFEPLNFFSTPPDPPGYEVTVTEVQAATVNDGSRI